jgi:CheY-like chemotaxis protein
MARVGGFDLAQYVTKRPHLAGVPVLLLTGAFDTIDERKVTDSGAAGVIVKPFEPILVMSRVKELLGLAKQDQSPVKPAPGRMITSTDRSANRQPVPPRSVGPPKAPTAATSSAPAAAPQPAPAAATPPSVPPVPPATITPSSGSPLVPSPSRDASPQRAAGTDLSRGESAVGTAAPVESRSGGAQDYLDRLDAAFDNLDAQLSGRAPNRPAAAARTSGTDSGIDKKATDMDGEWFSNERTAPHGAKTAARSVSPVDALLAQPASVPSAPPAAVQISDQVIERIAARVSERQGPSPPPPAVEVPEGVIERIAMRVGERLTPPPASPSAPAPLDLSDEAVQRIATRVAAQLTEGVLIETVTQVVTAVTERLVREEIARIRASAQVRKS